ncbi:plastid-lipid-associated protein, chloroplastic-like [Mangifera indica]|uniref:plastid-lipid-associated protein, chloroplastic-like n=1 Tax=Mangifera indica TaxID=29780 RepID=UPI001CFBF823|nr:plastid-lipid-associated protein, chloroplastic-like [Mangifera indica]
MHGPWRSLQDMTANVYVSHGSPSEISNRHSGLTDKTLKNQFYSPSRLVRSRASCRWPVFVARAVDYDEWYPDKEDEGAAVAVTEEEKPVEMTEIENLKKALIDSFYGTDRGLTTTSETRTEIVDLIRHLEAKNPTPAPTEALTLLNSK